MKKWLIGIGLVALTMLSAIYLFIPQTINISKTVTVRANQQGSFRLLADKNNWKKWWPGTDSSTIDSSHLYNGLQYTIGQVLHNAFEIKISKSKWETASLLQIFSYAIDSIGLRWSAQVETGINPIAKVRLYLAASALESDLEVLLQKLHTYLDKLKNVYGIDIRKEKVQMQLLISTRQVFGQYPNNTDVYALVQKLKDYRQQFDAGTDSFPMLNIQKLDSVSYAAQVAIQVNKKIPDRDDIAGKWMMKGGNILTGEVMGGKQRIDSAMKQMEKYISDHQRTIIAIPFQLLLTDRSRQPDSTRWLTRLYYPVI